MKYLVLTALFATALITTKNISEKQAEVSVDTTKIACIPCK